MLCDHLLAVVRNPAYGPSGPRSRSGRAERVTVGGHIGVKTLHGREMLGSRPVPDEAPSTL